MSPEHFDEKIDDELRVILQLTAALYQVAHHEEVEEIYQNTSGGSLPPFRVAEVVGLEAEEVACAYFEAWDSAIHRFWLNDKDGMDRWRDLLVPSTNGFAFPLLLLNGFWLRASHSKFADEVALLPTDLASLPVDEQARALGAFLSRADSRVPVDYAEVATALKPELRAAFAFWFLGVYLVSPRVSLEREVRTNRQRGMASFQSFHDATEIDFPPVLRATTAAAFRSVYQDPNPLPFISSVAERLIRPVLQPAWDDGLSLSIDGLGPVFDEAAPCDSGVVLSFWEPGKAVHRCVSTVIEPLRQAGTRAYVCSPDPTASVEALPEEWRAGVAHLDAGSANSVWDLRAFADKIRGHHLDFLYFTEVGLSVSTRWLSTQRMARVQATGYGHPVSTGSSAMDFFVGGEALERDGASYTERLILLPGLGVDTAPPVEPTESRARPLDGDELLVASLASFDKWNPAMLTAWREIMTADGSANRLALFPSAPLQVLHSLAPELAGALGDATVDLIVTATPADCVNALVNADLYLDTFPFGGYNTLIEAFSTGCPVVTYEGKHAYQRAGAAMIRLLGLPELLITDNWTDYVATAQRLLKDPVLRAEIRAQLTREHVLKTLCSGEMAAHFQAAVEWMKETGPGSSGPPVRIEAGSAPRSL